MLKYQLREYHDTFPEMEYTLADEMVVEDIIDDVVITPNEDDIVDENPIVEEINHDLEEDEVIISIDGETPPQEEEQSKAPEWVRKLRKDFRNVQRENSELKQQIEVSTVSKPIELGRKPSLEDYDYDAEVFESELSKWFDNKRKVDDAVAIQKAEQDKQQEQWQNTLQSYEKAKTELKVRDYEFAEDVVSETLSQTQQGIVLQGTDNPAMVVYALGRNPKKAKELAAITDPVKFAFAVAKLEGTLKVTNRKAPPPPEKAVTGTAKMSGTVDSTLERLRNEAEKTGDYTKIHAYKKQKRSN